MVQDAFLAVFADVSGCSPRMILVALAAFSAVPLQTVFGILRSHFQHLISAAVGTRHPVSTVGRVQPAVLHAAFTFYLRGTFLDALEAAVVFGPIVKEFERIAFPAGCLVLPLTDLVGMTHAHVFVRQCAHRSRPPHVDSTGF
jgi:hypothetical protein